MQKRKFLILKKQQLYDSKFRIRRQSLEFKDLQKTINRSLNKSNEAETIEDDRKSVEPETDEAENRKRPADAIDDKTEPSRPKRKSNENDAPKENRKRTAEDDENQNVKRQKKQDDQPESNVNPTEKPNLKYLAKLDQTSSSDASLQIDEKGDNKGESEVGSEDGSENDLEIGNEVTIKQNHLP